MTWDIVLTADEPEALIVANVAYHLATGAQNIHVYLDRLLKKPLTISQEFKSPFVMTSTGVR